MSNYDLFVGNIVRHKGERKVIRGWYYTKEQKLIVEFVDRTKCDNMKEIEWDGRK